MSQAYSKERVDLASVQEPLKALVGGKVYDQLPKDLYIPPDALEVFLEAFEGPLDLLLYLIKQQNMDILNIPILTVTEQYVDYIGMMQGLRMELAAEYLVMAAMLAEIKSKLLLPRQIPIEADDEEADPRAELVKKLLQYERYKQAANELDALPRLYRDNFTVTAKLRVEKVNKPLPDVELKALVLAFKEVLKRTEQRGHHTIEREALSVTEKMSRILELLKESSVEFLPLSNLFNVKEGRLGVVITFLALLELCKEKVLAITQGEFLGEVWLKTIQ